MRHLLEYDDPELDRLLGDLRDLDIARDRVQIRFKKNEKVIFCITFPSKNEGSIKDIDILRCMGKLEYEIEDDENIPETWSLWVGVMVSDSLEEMKAKGEKTILEFIKHMTSEVSSSFSEYKKSNVFKGEYVIDGRIVCSDSKKSSEII